MAPIRGCLAAVALSLLWSSAEAVLEPEVYMLPNGNFQADRPVTRSYNDMEDGLSVSDVMPKLPSGRIPKLKNFDVDNQHPRLVLEGDWQHSSESNKRDKRQVQTPIPTSTLPQSVSSTTLDPFLEFVRYCITTCPEYVPGGEVCHVQTGERYPDRCHAFCNRVPYEPCPESDTSPPTPAPAVPPCPRPDAPLCRTPQFLDHVCRSQQTAPLCPDLCGFCEWRTQTLSPTISTPLPVVTLPPSISPTSVPTDPTQQPSSDPSNAPTSSPASSLPTGSPTNIPTSSPTLEPATASPTNAPTGSPNTAPTHNPTGVPSVDPTTSPSGNPSAYPTSSTPSVSPSVSPSDSVPTSAPSSAPSATSSRSPSLEPTSSPSNEPSNEPTMTPSGNPSAYPTSSTPSVSPSVSPSDSVPTSAPSSAPSVTSSRSPSLEPTSSPSNEPSNEPTMTPSNEPTMTPSYLTTAPSQAVTTTPPPDNSNAIPLPVCMESNGAVSGFVQSLSSYVQPNDTDSNRDIIYGANVVVAPGTTSMRGKVGDGPWRSSPRLVGTTHPILSDDVIYLRTVPYATTVFVDSTDRSASIAFVPYGNSSNTPVHENIDTTITIIFSDDLQHNLDQENIRLTPSISMPSSNGRPGVASVSLPMAVFYSAQQQQHLWMDITLFVSRGDVTVNATERVHLYPVSSTSTLTGLGLSLPKRNLHRREQFVFPVTASFDRLLQTVQIVVRADRPGIRLRGFVIDSETGWTGRTNTGDGDGTFLSGTFTRSSLSSAVQNNVDVLFQVQAEVIADATLGQVNISVSFDQCANAIGDLVSLEALVMDRNGTHTNSGKLEITEAVKGIIATTQQTELWNSAVLSGVAEQQVNMHVWTISSTGISQAPPSALECVSNSSIISTFGCIIGFSGSETEGSSAATVTLRHRSSNASSQQDFKVWFPELPINISLINPVLKSISGWYATCAGDLRYQRTRIVATASYGLPDFDIPTFDIDISERILFSTNNTSVAIPTNAGNSCFLPSVEGVAPGSARVIATGSTGVTLGWASIQVVDTSVTIQRLKTVSYREVAISIAEPEPTEVNYPSTHNLLYHLNQSDLTQPGDQLQVHSTFEFTDGSWMELKPTELNMISTAPETIAVVSGNTAQVPVPGRNNLNASLVAIVNTIECGGSLETDLNIESRVPAAVNLPSATGVDLTLVAINGISEGLSSQPPRLVPPGNDALQAIGAATEAFVEVNLLYGTERRTYPTNSNSTIIRIRNESRIGLVTLSRVDGQAYKVQANPSQEGGIVTLAVSFAHEDITATISIQVAAFADLDISVGPYPRFAGSTTSQAIRLAPIGIPDSNVWERAELWTSIRLSNGESLPFMNTNTVFSGSESHEWANISGPNGQSSIIYPMGRNASNMTISATFGSISSRVPQVVDVTSTPVYPTTISRVSVLALQPNGRCRTVDQARTIFGLIGTTAETSVTIVMNNGRKYESMYFGSLWHCTSRSLNRNGTELLNGLVVFRSSSPSLEISEFGGDLRLANNSDSFVRIDITAGNSTAFVETMGNLDCEGAGDLDLGHRTGVPLPPRATGDTFTISVRAPRLNVSIRSFNIDIYFNTSVLRIAGQGPDYRDSITNAGDFLALSATANNDGLKVVGSLENQIAAGSDVVQLFGVELEALNPGQTRFGGAVVEMLSGNSEQIIPANIVSAANVLQIVEGNRRRDVHFDPANLTPHIGRRSSGCVPHSCLAEQRQRGDVNGDCCFTLADSLDIIKWVEAQALQNSGQPLSSDLSNTVNRVSDSITSDFGQRWADADGNGRALELLDAVFLNDVIGNAKVLPDPIISSSSACIVRLATPLYGSSDSLPADLYTLHYRMHAVPFGSSNITAIIGDLIAPSVNYTEEVIVQSQRQVIDGVALFVAELRVNDFISNVTVSADVTYWGQHPPLVPSILVGDETTGPNRNLFFSEFTYSVKNVVSAVVEFGSTICMSSSTTVVSTTEPISSSTDDSTTESSTTISNTSDVIITTLSSSTFEVSTITTNPTATSVSFTTSASTSSFAVSSTMTPEASTSSTTSMSTVASSSSTLSTSTDSNFTSTESTSSSFDSSPTTNESSSTSLDTSSTTTESTSTSIDSTSMTISTISTSTSQSEASTVSTTETTSSTIGDLLDGNLALEAEASSDSSSNSVVIIAVVLILLIAIVIAIVIKRKRRRAPRSSSQPVSEFEKDEVVTSNRLTSIENEVVAIEPENWAIKPTQYQSTVKEISTKNVIVEDVIEFFADIHDDMDELDTSIELSKPQLLVADDDNSGYIAINAADGFDSDGDAPQWHTIDIENDSYRETSV